MNKQSPDIKQHSSQPVSDEIILKVAKEVVIKFIEIGRLSPQNFADTFQEIYTSVRTTVKDPSK